MTDPTKWTINSDVGKNQALGLFIAFLGVPFILLTLHHIKISAFDGAFVGFCLGILLIGIGVWTFLFSEAVTVTVDPGGKRLVVQRTNRLGQNFSVLRFDQIASIDVRRIGGHRAPESYHLMIELKSGQTEKTGRWSFDQSEIVALCERLATEIDCDSNVGVIVSPIDINKIVYSGIGAVVIYASWFRICVGPWCRAMWFGTAPPFIIIFSFFGILGILRRIAPRQ